MSIIDYPRSFRLVEKSCILNKTNALPCMLYVLKLEGGKYYVGKSALADASRLLDYREGLQLPVWVQQHPFVEVLYVDRTRSSEAEEDILTLQTMLKFGEANVRGGQWSSLQLPHSPLEAPFAAGVCYVCRAPGHYAAQCPEVQCFLCGGAGHTKQNCPNPGQTRCFRCGQAGHTQSQCPNPTLCFNCEQSGHSLAQCPHPRRHAQSGRCFRCNEPGHFASSCPNSLRV